MDEYKSCKKEAEIWYAAFEKGRYSGLKTEEKKDYDEKMRFLIKRFNHIYEDFEDEHILRLIKDRAAEIGHIPSQKEIFPVYRFFIRSRFKNWPTALRKAGLKLPKVKKDHNGRKKK